MVFCDNYSFKKLNMKKVFGSLLLFAVMALSASSVSAQSIPGLPSSKISDVAGTATDLTSQIGDIVGGLDKNQTTGVTSAVSDLLSGLNKDVIPKQLRNPMKALNNFNLLKEIFNGKLKDLLTPAMLAKFVGGNSNGAAGALLNLL
jgi:hypothetical protein